MKPATLKLSSSSRKSLEARVKRLEEMIGRMNDRKAAIEAQLANPEIYAEASQDTLKAAVLDQAYVAKELVQLESEWLEKQAQLEQPIA